jgi:hypothetical protein
MAVPRFRNELRPTERTNRLTELRYFVYIYNEEAGARSLPPMRSPKHNPGTAFEAGGSLRGRSLRGWPVSSESYTHSLDRSCWAQESGKTLFRAKPNAAQQNRFDSCSYENCRRLQSQEVLYNQHVTLTQSHLRPPKATESHLAKANIYFIISAFSHSSGRKVGPMHSVRAPYATWRRRVRWSHI